MKSLKSPVLICLGFLIIGSVAAATSSNTNTDFLKQQDLNQSFPVFLNQWRVEEGVTSVVVGVEDFKSGQVSEYISGTKDQTTALPTTPNLLYGIGSLSKTFVSATLLQLEAQKALSLDNKLGQYFPNYPNWSQVTLRELLNMTSGIPNYTDLPEFKHTLESSPTQLIDPQQWTDLAYKQSLYFKPGSGWHYSNTNYLLAAMIIGQVTQQRLEDVYQTRFWAPLHLTQVAYTDTTYSSSVLDKMAHAYANGQDVTNLSPGLWGAAGNMVMSNVDLIAWVQALFTPGLVLYGNGPSEFAKTVAVPDEDPRPKKSRYGLGVFYTDMPDFGPVWWYTGVIKGYTSTFVFIPLTHKIIVVQAASWPASDDSILFPNHELMQVAMHKFA